MAADRLKLRAEDAADLDVLGAVLQDAIVPLADMLYIREERRFCLVVNRFMWERPPETVADEQERPAPAWMRVHGLLTVLNVGRVLVRGIDQSARDEPRALLALRYGDGVLDLEFAGGGTIRLELDRVSCLLEDLGEPWPTRVRPLHDPSEAAEGGAPDAAGAAGRERRD